MATYYVRASMGNDGNTGLSPAQAWLTVDHAANQVAAADLVHIGAGVYRELVTMDTPGTSGNEITFRGDATGEFTGDAGIVVITAHNANDAAPVRNNSLDLGTEEFIIWENVNFDGGLVAAVTMGNGVANIAFEGVVFEGCTFLGGPDEDDFAVYITVEDGATPTGNGLQVRQCVIMGNFYIAHDNNAVAHTNLKWSIENIISIMRNLTSDFDTISNFNFEAGTNSTYSIGGIDFKNILMTGGRYGIRGHRLKNTTNPVRMLNCIGFGHERMSIDTSCAANAMYAAYNMCNNTINGWGTGTMDNGGNNDSIVECPFFRGGTADQMFQALMGWSFMGWWEPFVEDPSIDYGGEAAPSEDLWGNPRPMQRNVDDAGPVEARARPQDETVTVYSGSHAFKFEGAGFHDFDQELTSGVAITVTVYARYDGNYTGSLPVLRVMDVEGQADQADAMAVGANTWEQLSIVVNPTVTGFCRLRIESRDTSVNGECFFDLLQVA